MRSWRDVSASWVRPSVIASLLLLSASPIHFRTARAQQSTCTTGTACASTCSIPLATNKLVAGSTYGVCAESTVTGHANAAALQSAISRTVNGWNAALSSIPSASRPAFEVNCTSTRQVKVRLGDVPGDDNARAVLNSDNGGGTITVEPGLADHLDADSASAVFGHETGHLVGLGNATSANGCSQADTLMFKPVDLTQPFSCAPSDCDKNRASQQYNPPPEESCPNPGECQNWNTVDCRCEDEVLNFQDKGVSPIILALNSSAYRLVGPSQGVDFDLDADGLLDRIGWTRANDMVGFLALDRNRNGLIDNGRELFGNYTPLEGDSTAAHGFDALSYWDAPSAGGNADGWIADTDLVWRHLLIWVDLNHDGISQPGELHPLSTFNITRISTSAFPERRRDAFANEFRLRGQFIIDGHPRWAYDVYFAVVR